MIPYSKQSINKSDINEVIKALKSDFLTGGSRVKRFENALCKYLNAPFAVVFNSATSALHVSFLLGEFKKDDEFITTALTFAATSTMGLQENLKPVFCDINEFGNIDENKIESLITNKTKAIVAVDFAGMPLNIKKLKQIANKHKLLLIDDASHALGSKYDNSTFVGTIADLNVFSFHAIKPITTCEGGAIVTNCENFYKKALLFRSHNIQKQGLWDSSLNQIGYNYRLSDVACALGYSQLKRLDKFIQTREKIALFYDMSFEDNLYFKTIKKPLHVRHSRHLYPILLNEEFWDKKEFIFKALHKKGIGVQVHYKPLFEYELFKPFFTPNLQNTQNFYKSELSLPCHQQMSLKDAKYIAKTLFNILEKL